MSAPSIPLKILKDALEQSLDAAIAQEFGNGLKDILSEKIVDALVETGSDFLANYLKQHGFIVVS